MSFLLFCFAFHGFLAKDVALEMASSMLLVVLLKNARNRDAFVRFVCNGFVFCSSSQVRLVA